MYPDEIKEVVIDLRKKGKSYREIGNILDLSKSTVQNLSTYKKSCYKKKRGPKYAINKRQSTKLKRFIVNENESGIKVNATYILRSNDMSCSRQTVCRWLKKHDYKFKKEAQQIVLSKKHKCDRISKISSWVSKNIQWDKTAFVDEKRFSLDGPDNW